MVNNLQKLYLVGLFKRPKNKKKPIQYEIGFFVFGVLK